MSHTLLAIITSTTSTATAASASAIILWMQEYYKISWNMVHQIQLTLCSMHQRQTQLINCHSVKGHAASHLQSDSSIRWIRLFLFQLQDRQAAVKSFRCTYDTIFAKFHQSLIRCGLSTLLSLRLALFWNFVCCLTRIQVFSFKYELSEEANFTTSTLVSILILWKFRIEQRSATFFVKFN